jgi:hypothetical protein
MQNVVHMQVYKGAQREPIGARRTSAGPEMGHICKTGEMEEGGRKSGTSDQ